MTVANCHLNAICAKELTMLPLELGRKKCTAWEKEKLRFAFKVQMLEFAYKVLKVLAAECVPAKNLALNSPSYCICIWFRIRVRLIAFGGTRCGCVYGNSCRPVDIANWTPFAGRQREGGRRGVGGTHWTWQDDGFGTRFDSVKCKIFSQRFACSHKDSKEGGEGVPGGVSWGAAAGAALSWRRT